MEKIFDSSVVGYLIETGVSQDEINRLQFNALKKGAIGIIKSVLDLMESDEFDNVEAVTGYSGAGDGWGSENNFINFGSIISNDGITYDILEVCEHLRILKNRIKN